jgi:hypothetical protein
VELEPGREAKGKEPLGPGEGVEDEDRGDDGESRPHYPPGGQEEDQKGQGAEEDIPLAGNPAPDLGDAVIVHHHVKGPRHPQKGENPVP